MIKLVLKSDKTLELVNRGKIYYGENHIGNIDVFAPDTIGGHETDVLEVTLYICRGEEYIPYTLDFDENYYAYIPITNDITDYIGGWSAYAEFTRDSTIIGRTNLCNFTVYDFPNRRIEIPKRENLFAQINELTDIKNSQSSDLNSVKEALIYKEADIDENTPTSEYGNTIRNMATAKLFFDVMQDTVNKELILPQGLTCLRKNAFLSCTSIEKVVIPEGVISINQAAFNSMDNLKTVVLPSSLTTIDKHAFASDRALKNISLHEGITTIGNYAFHTCSSIEEITIPSTIDTITPYSFDVCTALNKLTIRHGVTKLLEYSFYGCSALKTLFLPNTITACNPTAFGNNTALEFVTLENGFNSNNLWLSSSTLYSAQTIVGWLNALADRTGQNAYTLTIGAVNIAKLTPEQIAIATNKNWILA